MSNKTKKVRILQVIGKMDVGGAENFLMNIYRNINREEVQFDFIVHTEQKGFYEDEIEALGGKIIARVPRFNGYNLVKYKREWKQILKDNPYYSVIHIHIRSVATLIIPVAKKYGLKVIVHSHGTKYGDDLISKIKLLMTLPIRHQSDYLFACSKLAGQYAYGLKKVSEGKVKILNNAIDIQKYDYDIEIRSKVKKELDIENKIVIGHVGRFTYAKNHQFLIEVFKEFHRLNNNSVLLLVGDGELKNEIVEQVKAYGLEDNVIYSGVVSNVYDYLQCMDVFIFPSRFEGLPVSLIEAQASGLPCLISENISEEVDITNLIHRESFEKDSSIWARKTFELVTGSKRESKINQITEAGYDVRTLSNEMKEFYKEISEK